MSERRMPEERYLRKIDGHMAKERFGEITGADGKPLSNDALNELAFSYEFLVSKPANCRPKQRSESIYNLGDES